MPLQFVAQGPMQLPVASSALGIGDVVPGATMYAGLRVYSTAQVGHLFGVAQRQSDNAITNNLVFGANGFPNLSNVDGSGNNLLVWRDLAGATTLTLRFLYEQINNIASGATAVRLNIVNVATGVLTLGTDTSTEYYSWGGTLTGNTTSGGKFSLVGTAKHLSGGATSGIIGSLGGSTNWDLENLVTADTARALQNTSTTALTAIATDNAWHGLVASLDNANSFMYVDASKTSTGTASSDNITSNDIQFMSVGGFDPYKGRCFETAIYGTALSDANAQLITGNIAAMITSTGLP